MPTLEINATQPWLISRSGIVTEELATVVSANSDESRDFVLQRATRLRQSILQKAFTGELIS